MFKTLIMKIFKSTFASAIILILVFFSSCNVSETSEENLAKFPLILGQTESGKKIVKNQESLIPNLEKALSENGFIAVIEKIEHRNFSTEKGDNENLIIARDANGLTSYGILLSEIDENNTVHSKATIKCEADNCQQNECVVMKIKVNGEETLTCSNFVAPCKCKKTLTYITTSVPPVIIGFP